MSNFPEQAIYAIGRLRILRERVYQESLESVAGHLKLSRSYVSNIENLHSEPRISTILMLCRHYGIELDELLRGCPGLNGKPRIPSPEQLTQYAKKLLGLRAAHIQAIFDSKRTEYLWLAICAVGDGQDEAKVHRFRDWILLESGMYHD